MAIQLDDLANEILSKILDLLPTNEKFLVRAVCKKWKNQIDENVTFHTFISNKDYDLIKHRFGTGRLVKSLHIYNYNRQDIPISNLNSLRYLSVGSEVSKSAAVDVLSRALKLNELHLDIDHGNENAIIPLLTELLNYPALRHVYKLCIGYESLNRLKPCESQRAWNNLLYCELPNVQRLEVSLVLNPVFPQLRGFDFFRLAAGMPNLQEFKFKILCLHDKGYYNLPGDVQPLTPDISRGINNLKLSKVEATVLEKDENVWKDLLARQRQLKILILYNDEIATRGFSLSMLYPVLQSSRKSIEMIALQIDTERNIDVDAEIFANTKSLRVLNIKAYPVRSPIQSIRNCHSVVSATLETLSIKGFNFAEEDATKIIKNIPPDQLNRVHFEVPSTWTDFENRLDEMGLVRLGHSAGSKYETTNPNSIKTYYGMGHDFSGLQIGDFSKKVKNIQVERESLNVQSGYFNSYASFFSNVKSSNG